VNIGLISFSSEAKYHGTFTPCDPSNPSEKNPLLMAELQGFRSLGFTHFDLALSKALNFFNDVPKDRSNFLIFLSDGVTNIADDTDIEESTSNFNNKLPRLE
jgi:Mg-chelatase subunit ChlD